MIGEKRKREYNKRESSGDHNRTETKKNKSNTALSTPQIRIERKQKQEGSRENERRGGNEVHRMPAAYGRKLGISYLS